MDSCCSQIHTRASFAGWIKEKMRIILKKLRKWDKRTQFPVSISLQNWIGREKVEFRKFGLLKDNIGWLSVYPTCSSFEIRFLGENTNQHEIRNWNDIWIPYILQNLKFWEKRGDTKKVDWEIEEKEEKKE